MNSFTPEKIFRWIMLGAAVLLLLVIVFNSFTIIPTGFTGVRSTFGQIDSNPVQVGFNLKIPFVQSVAKVNNKQQDITIEGQISGESSERTVVIAENIVITYQVSSQKSAWIYANVSRYSDDLVTPVLVSSAVKSAMVGLDTTHVTRRERIEPLAKEKLQDAVDEKYGDETIIIIKVVINNLDFEESYNDAIAQKQVAQQEYERAQIENSKAVEKAEAEAKQKKVAAEAEANAIKIKAEAQAEANNKLRQSLNDTVVEYEKVQKWNGELPYVSGSSGTIIDLSPESTTKK